MKPRLFVEENFEAREREGNDEERGGKGGEEILVLGTKPLITSGTDSGKIVVAEGTTKCPIRAAR